MYDRDELIRARIDNYLNERKSRLDYVKTFSGKLAVRQATADSITIGSFTDTKREYKRSERNYFIESAPDEPGVARQLWLPALKWATLGTVRQREIVATESESSKRFEAWHSIQPLITNLDEYSEYDQTGQALYEQADLSLRYIDANNDNFRVAISMFKF